MNKFQNTPLPHDTLVFEDREIGVACPHCQTPLKVAFLQSEKVAGCHSCHGILIQSTALGPLIETLRANFQGADDTPQPFNPGEVKTRRTCPACDSRFETHSYCGPGNVVIDSCLECRMVWLDGGELARLIRAPGRRDYGTSPF